MQNARMSVLFDYFAARSDAEAAAVINRPGGPASPAATAPDGADQATTQNGLGYDTVSLKGIDPVVQLGTLEALLTGRSFDELLADLPADPLAIKNDGEQLVVALSRGITSALASATPESLDEVAVPWSQTDEFWGAADPAELAAALKELAGLARRAGANGHRLYCWICV